MGIGLDVIEPCGFPFSDAKLRRAGMDYIELASVTRHSSFAHFLAQKQSRLILVETDGAELYHQFQFNADDVLILGRESAGTPEEVYLAADQSVRIRQRAGRSLNVIIAASIVLGEALRQTGQLPQMG